MEKKSSNELKITLGFRNAEDKESIKEKIKKFIDDNNEVHHWVINDDGLREGGEHSI